MPCRSAAAARSFARSRRSRTPATHSLRPIGLPSESSASTAVQGSGFKTRRLKNGNEGKYRASTTAQPPDGDQHAGHLQQGVAQLLVFIVLGRPDERMAGQDDAAEHEQDAAHAEDAEAGKDEDLDAPG